MLPFGFARRLGESMLGTAHPRQLAGSFRRNFYSSVDGDVDVDLAVASYALYGVATGVSVQAPVELFLSTLRTAYS